MLAQLLRSNILPARMLLTARQSLWLRPNEPFIPSEKEGGRVDETFEGFTETFVRGTVQEVQITRPPNSFHGALSLFLCK
jgi:hypothetical protein